MFGMGAGKLVICIVRLYQWMVEEKNEIYGQTGQPSSGTEYNQLHEHGPNGTT